MYALGHPNYITINLYRYNAEFGKFKLLLLEQLLINWRIYKLHIKLNIILKILLLIFVLFLNIQNNKSNNTKTTTL